MDSPSCWVKDVMSVLSLAVLPGGKYLLRKAFERAAQVLNELGSSFCSQSLALSLSENGKSLSRIALVVTPVEFDGVTLRKEFAKVHVGVIRGVTAEMVPLHEGDERGTEFEVVGFDRRVHNRRCDTRRLWQGVIVQHRLFLPCHCCFCFLPPSRFSATPVSYCFYLKIQWDKVLIPLTPLVRTRANTTPV